jgi:hypothetical protein
VKPPGRNSAQCVSNSLSFSARRQHAVGLSNVALDLRSTGQFVDKHPVGRNKFIRSAQYICTGDAKETIYLRATDARSKGNRLAVSATSKGKVLWSKTVSTLRNYGFHYLQEVRKGKFGGVPDKGIE